MNSSPCNVLYSICSVSFYCAMNVGMGRNFVQQDEIARDVTGEVPFFRGWVRKLVLF